jgi:ribosomal protein S18 acetylase RimI-like enzyme
VSAVVRPALPEDAPRMAALMREFYQHEKLQYGPSVAVALASLLADGSQGRAWLFEAPDDDAGYLILTWGYSLEFGGRYGLVDELYVRDGYRNEGLGTRALDAAASACLGHGARAVLLEVDHANPNARRLYERIGFQAHARCTLSRRLHG